MSDYTLRSYARVAWLISLGLVLLFLDFYSKAYVYQFFISSLEHASFSSFPIFKSFMGIDFHISLAFNKGAAWGILSGFQIPLLILRMSVIFGIFVYLFFFNPQDYKDFPLICISAGALGNVIDYFLYGHVVDFLHFNFWGYHFAIFNFADTWITLGVIWLFIASFFIKKKNVRLVK